jgi:hypothetical protein
MRCKFRSVDPPTHGRRRRAAGSSEDAQSASDNSKLFEYTCLDDQKDRIESRFDLPVAALQCCGSAIALATKAPWLLQLRYQLN